MTKPEDDEPAVKIKTITLSKDPSETEYQVEKVTDSIEFTPGSYMNPADVQRLCDDELWKVTIVKFKTPPTSTR